MPEILSIGPKHDLSIIDKPSKRFLYSTVIHRAISEWRSWYSDWLRAGQSVVVFPIGTRDYSFLQNLQTDFGAYPTSYPIGTGLFPEG